ncbi:hypothetical protein G6F50_015806 [Rhizopus delemar]|uniref:Uncharacterized protein n=1 Tax=Rhizopus delemar TaxID=936053 RepID=A0A9P7C323_9FUNG|nr:hypothetical protein G6F50_015806 [Rhizopus delemar]
MLQAYQDFRRGTDHLQVADIQEVHVRRRIQCTQRAVHIHRARLERHAQALAEHYLEDVAGADVFLAALDRIDEAFAGEPGDEIGFVQHVAVERRRIARSRRAQLGGQCIQTGPGLLEGAVDTRVGMHDQVQAALEVVEHRQLIGIEQQDVRGTQFIAAGRRRPGHR